MVEVEANTVEPAMQQLFKPRLQHNEEVFKAAIDLDDPIPKRKTTKDDDASMEANDIQRNSEESNDDEQEADYFQG